MALWLHFKRWLFEKYEVKYHNVGFAFKRFSKEHKGKVKEQSSNHNKLLTVAESS